MSMVALSKTGGEKNGRKVAWRIEALDAAARNAIAMHTAEFGLLGNDVCLPDTAKSATAGMVAGAIIDAAEGAPSAVGPLLVMAWGR